MAGYQRANSREQKSGPMKIELINNRDAVVIRRLVPGPGEPMFWHKDNCHQFSLVLRGSRLSIEFQESKEIVEIDVCSGMTCWDSLRKMISGKPSLAKESGLASLRMQN
jgi:hypothetical protein